MCKIIAIANQKGGVAKTTTTINLGVGLSKVGKRVMLIDADPQGHLTMGLGFPKNLIYQPDHNGTYGKRVCRLETEPAVCDRTR
ncbi:Sporulation initiation inhibitor protein soj [uncultured Blautia sp.]|nr:Sporulation initiation inhibitor protein soj [uncultured Blautia sp.]